MKLFKNYKKLYLLAKSNQDQLIRQCSKIGAENVEYQKQIKMYKERCARLTCDLEDVDNLLKVETQKLTSAKKEIANLKRKNTILNKEIKKNEEEIDDGSSSSNNDNNNDRM